MRVVGLVINQEPRKTQGKPQENASKTPSVKATSKGANKK